MSLMKFREPNRVRWQGSRPAHDGTQIIGYNFATNDNAAVYTALAGETAFVHYMDLTWTAGANPGKARLQVWNAVPAVVSTIMDNQVLATSVGGKVVSLTYPLELIEGWSIRVVSTALLLRADGCILGWVE